jgi:succinate dehydrogenase / fumarate reductase cytochrome b subunit
MFISYLRSSVGKKFLMAASGAVYVGFVLMHMLGNLQIFLGRDAINTYAQFLQSTPEILWPFRAVVILALVVHVVMAVQITRENRKARGQGYKVQNKKDASLASRAMALSGVAIFAFVVYHIMHLTLGAVHPQFFHFTDEMGRHDVYRMMIASFQVPVISLTYIVAVLFLCLHLSHAVSAMLHSLGFSHPGNTQFVEKIGKAFSLIIFIGNTSMPVAILLGVLQ